MIWWNTREGISVTLVKLSEKWIFTSFPKMFTTEFESGVDLEFESRPKRMRMDTKLRHYDANGMTQRSLDIEGVIRVLSKYEDYDGGINCSICGKLYKSRVCFTKHLWEHTIYWDLFPGDKNQDRVLSIQAALILYSGYHGVSMDDDNVLSHLLVTAPNEKRPDQDMPSSPDFKKKHRSPKKFISHTSPLKRKKSFEM